MAKIFAMIASLFCATNIVPEPPRINAERTVIVEGSINEASMTIAGDALKAMAADSDEAIDIVIDSGGGEVSAGYKFVQLMDSAKAEGIELRCFVRGTAASMAFIIYTHCSTRFALNESMLLWHKAHVGRPIESFPKDQQAEIIDYLEGQNAAILADLHQTLGKYMLTQTIDFFYSRQTFHLSLLFVKIAPEFMTTFEKIPDLDRAFEKKAETTPAENADIK